MIKTMVIRGKLLVGFSSLRGIIMGRSNIEKCYYDKMKLYYNYREHYKWIK